MTALPPEIQTALDAMEPAFRARFLAAVEPITSPAMLYAIAGALLRGDAVTALLVATSPPALYAAYDAQITAAYLLGMAAKG